METILATAFGRVIDIQRGESDDLARAVDDFFMNIQEGGVFDATALVSLFSELYITAKLMHRSRAYVSFILNFSHAGNFPWMMSLLRFIITRSKRGEQFALLENIALDLVRARRESKHPGKVCCLYYYNKNVPRSLR